MVNEYKRLKELGIAVYEIPYPHIQPAFLEAGLQRAGLSKDKFDELFGVQTMIEIGGIGCPYPWDVEAVLERMLSKRVTGTQLHWD